MTLEKVAPVLLSALIGSGVGWAAQALTLSGRVQALEVGQQQVITRLDRLIEAAKGRP